jgi:AcrR family transcriptional regulator
MPERRTKSLTINAIEASASEVFCREGYDRASLREIAARAGVSLSSIHEYFDSKTGLYVSVGRLLFHRLESQRRALLKRALEAQAELSLDSVVYCMIAPVVLPEYNDDGLGACGSHQLRTWFDTWPVLEEHPQFREMLRESVEDWISQICNSLPRPDGGAGAAGLLYNYVVDVFLGEFQRLS